MQMAMRQYRQQQDLTVAMATLLDVLTDQQAEEPIARLTEAAMRARVESELMLGLGWRLPGGGTRLPWAGGRRERPAAPAEPTDFAGWVRRFGLTDAELRTLHRRHAARFTFLFGGALFALAFGATAALVTFGPALAALAVLLALLFLAGAASHALRAWQIRERRLGSFGEWVRNARRVAAHRRFESIGGELGHASSSVAIRWSRSRSRPVARPRPTPRPTPPRSRGNCSGRPWTPRPPCGNWRRSGRPRPGPAWRKTAGSGPRPPAWTRRCPSRWVGPYQSLVATVAGQTGYGYEPVGKAPVNPIIVRVNAEQIPAIVVLRDASWQVRDRAALEIDEAAPDAAGEVPP